MYRFVMILLLATDREAANFDKHVIISNPFRSDIFVNTLFSSESESRY